MVTSWVQERDQHNSYSNPRTSWLWLVGDVLLCVPQPWWKNFPAVRRKGGELTFSARYVINGSRDLKWVNKGCVYEFSLFHSLLASFFILFERMVHYYCVCSCSNNSTDQELSFHDFPKDKKLEKVSWETWDCISNGLVRVMWYSPCDTPILDTFLLLVYRSGLVG